MKVLLKYGGTRVGDCFHSMPLLKKLKDNNIKCDLAHGFYEGRAANLLLYLGLVDRLHSNTFLDGGETAGVNGDMNSIKRFLLHIGDMYDNEDHYDAILTPEEDNNGSLNGKFTSNKDIGIDFDDVPWACVNAPDVIVGNYIREDNYIGVQAASCSGFKTYNPLYAIVYPGDVKSFGYGTEKIMNDVIQIHGKSLIEVYEELMTCCMVVSTHSAIGILAYYLGIPQIFIHFWENTGTNLANRDNIVSLHAPGLSDLQVEIDKMWKKLN